MKSTTIKLGILALFVALTQSCAYHTGYMNSSVSLSSNNFVYVKRDVQGSARALYVFGFGGLKRQALVNEAKQNLLQNYQLQNNQALADVTVNWKQTLILPVMIYRCTVTASIVEFK